MPLMEEYEVYSTLRQNRQLANIEVHENSQTMELFLGISSLEPGENIKMVVPLRTKPSAVQCSKTTDEEFLDDLGLDTLNSLHEKQTGGFERFGERLGSNLATLFSSPFSLLTPTRYGGEGTPPPEHYEFEGISVDVYSIDSAETLENLLQYLDIDLPEQISSVLPSYLNQHAAVIEMETNSPIPQSEFDLLLAEAPEAISEFKSYMENHPKLIYEEYLWEEYLWGEWEEWPSYIAGDPELYQMAGDIENSVVRQFFFDLVAGTYGIGGMGGFVLSFEMPLDNGRAYFPLGTTPAWSAASRIDVVFSCSDDKALDFNRESKEVFYEGKHYYVWEFGGESPNYDLDGELQGGSSWQRFTYSFNSWLYDAAPSLSMFAASLIFVLAWFAFVIFCTRGLGWEPPKKRRSMLDMAVVGIFASILSVVISLPLALIVVSWFLHRSLCFRLSPVVVSGWLEVIAACILGFVGVCAIAAVSGFALFTGILSLIGFGAGVVTGFLILKGKRHWFAVVGIILMGVAGGSLLFMKDGWALGMPVLLLVLVGAALLENTSKAKKRYKKHR